MMNELDTFTINFVINGIDKVQDGIKNLSQRMDDIEKLFEKAGTKGNSFFDKFTTWGSKIAGLVGGIYAIKKAITDTINSSNEILALHKTADEVGRTAKEVEVLGLALRQFNPTMTLESAYGNAGSFYKALNNLRLNESRFDPSSDLMTELRYAHADAIRMTDSDQEIVRKLRQGVKYYQATQSPEMASASIEKLLSSAGISYKDMGGLFKASDADFNYIMEEMNKRAWRSDPKYQAEAQNLAAARLELSETWKKITDSLMPTVTKLIECFNNLLKILKPILDLIMPFIDAVLDIINNILTRLGKGTKDAVGEFQGARALGKLMNSSWWEGKSVEEIKEVYNTAKGFLDNAEGKYKTKWDTEKNRAILDISWKTLQMLESSGLNTMPFRDTGKNIDANITNNTNIYTNDANAVREAGNAAGKGTMSGLNYVVNTSL